MKETECVILCEGYHDRAFWAGWLLSSRCTDQSLEANGSTRRRPKDPWKSPVAPGQYAYLAPNSLFLRVQPCGGIGNVLPAARVRLRERITKPLSHLIINIDPDTESSSSETTGLGAKDVLETVNRIAADATLLPSGDIDLDGGKTRVRLIRWEISPPHNPPGLPTKNTLERLVSAAITEAYPGRGEAVDNWLRARPGPPKPCPKEHAWSYLAGWYAESGCDFFYQQLWSDELVRERLRVHLTASGAWTAVEGMVNSGVLTPPPVPPTLS